MNLLRLSVLLAFLSALSLVVGTTALQAGGSHQSSQSTDQSDAASKSKPKPKAKIPDNSASSTSSASDKSSSSGAPAAPQTPNKPSASATEKTPPANSSRMVWVNTDSGVYHKPGSRWYGKTKQGKYMSEADAVKAGYRAAAKQ